MGKRRTTRRYSATAYIGLVLSVGLVAVFAAMPANAQQPRLSEPLKLEVIELSHTTVDRILPMIKPFVIPSGSITGQQSQLIIKTSEANLAEIKHLLASLDKAPKMLRISVKQDVNGYFDYQHDGLSARIRGGDVSAGVGGRSSNGSRQRPGASIRYSDGRSSVQYDATRTRGERDDLNTHFVTTLEGRPALIYTGESTPHRNRSSYSGPYGTERYDETYYVDSNRGFYVTPRLTGNGVNLEVAPQLERHKQDPYGAVETHGVNTVVSGQLGQWIPIGGASQSQSGNQRELLARTRDRSEQSYNVWVKVEIAH